VSNPQLSPVLEKGLGDLLHTPPSAWINSLSRSQLSFEHRLWHRAWPKKKEKSRILQVSVEARVVDTKLKLSGTPGKLFLLYLHLFYSVSILLVVFFSIPSSLLVFFILTYFTWTYFLLEFGFFGQSALKGCFPNGRKLGPEVAENCPIGSDSSAIRQGRPSQELSMERAA
jgi:hypothetical protein